MSIYTYKNRDGSIGINSKQSFVNALDNKAVLNLPSFEDIFQEAERLVKTENPKVSGNALSNVRGNWYEWLIAIGALEFYKKSSEAAYLIPLPNIRQYDCAKLYQKNIFAFIEDLRTKVAEASDVSLITSNPDFVIIDRNISMEIPDTSSGLITPELIEEIDQSHLKLEHSCKLDQILGYTAVKSSLRPDRRLQIAHEGSLMKALYRHVQTREWIIDAPGIEYFAITSVATEADRNALKTVATHSITDVGSDPQAAVDGLFCVSNGAELEETLKQILL